MNEPLAILRKLVELDDRYANAIDANDMPLADAWTTAIEDARALLPEVEDQ